MTTVTVRLAIPEDAMAIHRLNIAFNDARATPEYIAESIRLRAQVEQLFVAELAGEVMGMAALRLLPCALDPEPYAELTELYVAEDARRRGVGQALVRAVEAAARAGGAHRLVLLTAWRNGTVHRFYHALEYQLYCITMQHELAEPDERGP
jgi:GNAT superfamily N-acetyltransferase